ncbi:DUF4124 domain-containing protein [Corallincola luteus]|uniref:DUF4124 domain-containing protein n=2 Tax=Corallincola TaxID=1775176 RepID=A0A368NLA9_9GAMM|nr:MULTISPECIES: DUF4124 domain-containing protein [Corallincola]RCU50946.1 DUF4124 domain-containing protein [Corallincola holothuriorum]TCI04008.1 DUF4124 domain-containing protein [Corallincola luteus]
MLRLLVMLCLAFSPLAQAKIYQCQDGSFQDTPCADAPGSEVNVLASPGSKPKAEIWGGLDEPAESDGQVVHTTKGHQCQMDYQTRSAIKDGIRAWTVRRCMTMAQVRKVSRGLDFREYSHVNGEGSEVVEWVFQDYRPQRVVFIEGLVVDMR